MRTVRVTAILLVLWVAVAPGLAGAQESFNLPPGTKLPPGYQLKPGWSYDQASGRLRPPGAPAGPPSAPGMPPGTALPPGTQLPPGWSYDQPTGRFQFSSAQPGQSRPAAAKGSPGQGAQSQVCINLNTQAAGFDRDAQSLQSQIADLTSRRDDLARKAADARRQRDQICPSLAAGTPPPGAAPQQGTSGKVANVPLAVVAEYLNSALQGMQVRLNNNPSPDSWIQFGSQLGNLRVPIQIPGPTPLTLGGTGVTVQYSMSDVRSTGVSVAYTGGRYVVTVPFAATRPKLFIDNIGMDIANMVMTAVLTPALDPQGRPSYGAVSGTATGNAACAGAATPGCQIESGNVNLMKGLLNGFLTSHVTGYMQQAFGTPDMQSRIGAALRATLDSPPGRQRVQQVTGVAMGAITATRLQGNTLVVEFQ